MTFLKKGINKKKGKHIYPHPNQTKTGNCFAYAAASCLYAFGLDHNSKLIPSSNESNKKARFQWQMGKMIEKLQDLLYAKKNSKPETIRKYLVACGVGDKFEVSEPRLKKRAYDPIAGHRTLQSDYPNWIKQMRACQNILLNIRWGGHPLNPFKKTYRHTVGLVGEDKAKGAFVLNNPWGKDLHLDPDQAADAFKKNKSNTFTKHKYKVDDTGNTKIPFSNDEAVIYGVVMVCPVKKQTASIRSSVDTTKSYTAGGIDPTEDRVALRTRIRYQIINNRARRANGLAVELTGLRPDQIAAMEAPEGWTVGPWYRECELGFDKLATEPSDRPCERTFAGVIWRRKRGGLKPKQKLSGFAIELEPAPEASEEDAENYAIDKQGHAIVLEERPAGITAWHTSATTLIKRPPLEALPWEEEA